MRYYHYFNMVDNQVVRTAAHLREELQLRTYFIVSKAGHLEVCNKSATQDHSTEKLWSNWKERVCSRSQTFQLAFSEICFQSLSYFEFAFDKCRYILQ